MISPLLGKLTSDEAKRIFRILDEDEDTCVFPHAYDYNERVFYIWALSSLFHDIAYPLEKLPYIGEGIGEFVRFFDYSCSSLQVDFDYPELYESLRYVELMSRLYGGKLEFDRDEKGRIVYKKTPDQFFRRVILEALRQRNHGVMSSFGLLLNLA